MATENKRRIPTGGTIMEDKKYNDLIYAYLQSISYRDPNKEDRYVWKNQFLKRDVAKLLRINFRTFQRKFDYLIESGYIIEKEDLYELPKVSQWNFFIPVDTLKFLVDATNEDIITVYAYLGQLKKTLKDKAYTTKSDLLIRLGYKTKLKTKDENGNQMYRASTNQRDWERINNILCMLDEKLNLIKCRIIKETYKDGYIEKIYYEVNTNIVKKDCYK